MKHLLTLLLLIITTMINQQSWAQCPVILMDTTNIIRTDATMGRDVTNNHPVARVCKGTQSKFWVNMSQFPNANVVRWGVFDSNSILKTEYDDTLSLDNIVATNEPLTIQLIAYNNGAYGFVCYEYTLKFEVLETSMNISYTNLQGTLVVSNIPNHYSVNIRSIPNGLDYSNGYLYDNGSLIFQLPNGSYQLMYTYQNHVWMNSPVCMAPLLFDTITITNSHVAVSYIEDDASVKLFPNPAHDYFVVEADVEIKSLMLFNSVGQEVLRQDYPTNQQIGIAGLPAGMYMIMLETDKRLVRKQLVKQ